MAGEVDDLVRAPGEGDDLAAVEKAVGLVRRDDIVAEAVATQQRGAVAPTDPDGASGGISQLHV